jgi:hypothetical protein
MTTPKNPFDCLRVRRETHTLAKTVAAKNRESLVDLTTRLLDPALKAEERKLDRMRSQRRPSHGEPVE